MGNVLWKKKTPLSAVEIENLIQKKGKDQPLFPLGEDVMIGMLPSFASIALTGNSILNLFASTSVAPLLPKGILRALLHLCPFTFAPLGVLGIILSTAATKSHAKFDGLADLASRVLMVELLYTVAIGGFCSVAMSGNITSLDTWKDPEVITAVVVTTVVCVAVIKTWSYILPYPKCILPWSATAELRGAEAAEAARRRATVAAEVTKNAAEDAVASAEDAQADATSAEGFFNNARAAEAARTEAANAEQVYKCCWGRFESC